MSLLATISTVRHTGLRPTAKVILTLAEFYHISSAGTKILSELLQEFYATVYLPLPTEHDKLALSSRWWKSSLQTSDAFSAEQI